MTEEKYLTKEDIINSNDLQMEAVKVKEWGGTIFVKELNVAERIEFEAALTENKEDKIIDKMLLLLSSTICDKDGNRLFTASDIKALHKKNVKVVFRLFRIANKLSSLSAESEEKLRKNSETSPAD